jgi:gluconate 2-dehydrogenase gamma chain
MNRREWLKSMSALAVGALAAPSLLAVFDAHAAARNGGPAPRFFAPAQDDVVTAVVDIIVPRTDTPGAIDAGVPRFIDQMFKDVYTPEEQQRYLGALAAFEKESGEPFAQLDATQRQALVTRLHAQALASGKHLDPVSAPAFVLMTKKLAMLGFFMSQPGCTRVLQYDAVPGAWHGDIPRSEAGNGKAWAVETSLRI